MHHRHDEFNIRADFNLKMLDSVRLTSPRRTKRFRSAFTTDQVNYLESQFKKSPYVGVPQRKEIADVLKISERAIKIWFQNRRMKEKKETGKDYEDDIRSSLDYAREQFIIGNNPPINEQHSVSLPILTTTDNNNKEDNSVINNSLFSWRSEILPPSSGFKVLEVEPASSSMPTPLPLYKPHHQISPNKYKSSAEFSIDLYKKYKKEISGNTQTPLPQTNAQPALIIDKGIFQATEVKPIKGESLEQDKPEDLSPNRKSPKTMKAETPKLPPNTVANDPGYVSVVSPLYAQPYYAPNNVIWKPINVVPTVTDQVSTTSMSVTTSKESGKQKCCSCDCHVKPMFPYSLQPQSQSTPQYIIAAFPASPTTTTKF